VGEGCSAGQAQHDEVLVVEVLIGAILVCVEVQVCERPAVGVLGVSYARYLQPYQPLVEGLFGV
jgi:hypothetical protein